MEKVTKDHELVQKKIRAGLTPEDAIEVAQRQIEHDEAIAPTIKKKSSKADEKE